MFTMTQAGGRADPSWLARRSGNRAEAMTRAAFDRRAASRVPGRLSTPMGTRAAISRQRSQRLNCTRLSEPISQVKCRFG